MMFYLYNHNGTFLGSFDTERDAINEARYYTEQTGNATYMEQKQ